MYGGGGGGRRLGLEPDALPCDSASEHARRANMAPPPTQPDVYGEVVDALYQAREHGLPRSDEYWSLAKLLLDWLETGWQEPDDGIWEVRGPKRHFTHSKVMAWVAFDRAVKTVERHGREGPADHWREIRDRIHAQVLEKGWNDEVGAFTQFYGSSK